MKPLLHYSTITAGRIIVFDFIDANRFIPYINENHHTSSRVRINYIRESTGKTTLDNFMVEWMQKYYTVINEKRPDSQ
jgi:hypothetical protein